MPFQLCPSCGGGATCMTEGQGDALCYNIWNCCETYVAPRFINVVLIKYSLYGTNIWRMCSTEPNISVLWLPALFSELIPGNSLKYWNLRWYSMSGCTELSCSLIWVQLPVLLIEGKWQVCSCTPVLTSSLYTPDTHIHTHMCVLHWPPNWVIIIY